MAKEAQVEQKSYTQYAVIVFPDLAQLVDEVTKAMSKGWNPLGGIATMTKGNEVYHYQAVAK